MTTELWTHYRASIRVERLVAGIPASAKVMASWLDARAAKKAKGAVPVGVPAGVPASFEEIAADQAAMLTRDESEELRSVIFYRDADGRPVFEGRCVKAALKEAANVTKELSGKKNWRARLAERVFVVERWIPITAPVGVDERVVHAMTMQGPRSSIKRFEFAEDVDLSFTLRVLNGGAVQEEDLRMLLDYAAQNGIGSDRSQGAGIFKVLAFERVP